MAERGRRVLADRVLKRLAMARARVGLLQRRLRRGETLDPSEAAAHLADVDQAVGEAARLAAAVRSEAPVDAPDEPGKTPGRTPAGSPKRVLLRPPTAGNGQGSGGQDVG